MSTVAGQSTDPIQPGVLGTPMNANIPGTQAVGVKGDGGAGFPSPIPINPAGGRTAVGVLGTSADPHGEGVWGENTAGGVGVYGRSKGSAGQFDGNLVVNGNASVSGTDPIQPGVLGKPLNVNIPGTQAVGVKGDGGAGFPSPIPINPAGGRTSVGVLGTSADPHGEGVLGENTAGGVGVYGRSNGAAAQFDGKLVVNGNASVSGTLTVVTDIILSGADCAEEFDVMDPEVSPGTVVVIANENGALRPCDKEYQKTVAGVISGAGGLRPGIVLDRQASQGNRMSVALVGKVYCKVDAQYAPVGVGDLLTTSPTTGYAMRASDPHRCFGAVIGKALCPLTTGRGSIPILVALQ
jgi:hypothetical protein